MTSFTEHRQRSSKAVELDTLDRKPPTPVSRLLPLRSRRSTVRSDEGHRMLKAAAGPVQRSLQRTANFVHMDVGHAAFEPVNRSSSRPNGGGVADLNTMELNSSIRRGGVASTGRGTGDLHPTLMSPVLHSSAAGRDSLPGGQAGDRRLLCIASRGDRGTEGVYKQLRAYTSDAPSLTLVPAEIYVAGTQPSVPELVPGAMHYISMWWAKSTRFLFRTSRWGRTDRSASARLFFF